MISLSGDQVMHVTIMFLVINLIISDATQAIGLRQQITADRTLSQTPKDAKRRPSNRCSPTNKNCITLRVVPHCRGCFNPTHKRTLSNDMGLLS